jgi:ribosome maturation factor RimP
MPADTTTKRVYELIDPIVTEEGCDLLDVELASEFGQRILRVYIGKEPGVGIQDCSRVSQAIEDVIEVEGGVTGRYNLEVSSPGVNRPLTKDKHFRDAIGCKVKIQTIEKIDGRQNYKGILKSADGVKLTVEIDGQEFSLPVLAVRKACLVVIE